MRRRARDFKLRDVHICHDYRSKMAGSMRRFMSGCAQSVDCGGLYRPEQRRDQCLRRHRKEKRSGLIIWLGIGGRAIFTDRLRCFGRRRRCCGREVTTSFEDSRLSSVPKSRMKWIWLELNAASGLDPGGVRMAWQDFKERVRAFWDFLILFSASRQLGISHERARSR